MKETSIMEKIEQAKKIIKEKYDMTYKEICQIRDCSPDDFFKLTNSFAYGYGQGYKAAMAEMKKKAKEAKTV